MKLFSKLGALGKHIRGWLPMEAVSVAVTLNGRRRVFISGAGLFFIVIGAVFMPLVIPWYYVINGPLAQFVCPPLSPCTHMALDVGLGAPVFLIVLGEVLVSLGLYLRPARHGRPIKGGMAAGGALSVLTGTLLLPYVPTIPPYLVFCNSTVCIASMTPITPFVLIALGVAFMAFGILYSRRRSAS